MFHTFPLIVRAANRVWVPDDRTPSWFRSREVFLYPLGWDRELRVSRRRFLQAWRIVPSIEEHIIETEKADDIEAADLAGLIFPWQIGSKTSSSSWAFTLPQVLRERGWLPSEGAIVLMDVKGDDVAIWHGEAHEQHVISVSKRWADRLR